MAKLIDWDLKIDVRSSVEDKYEHLGRRTTQGSVLKVCDDRSCFVMTFAVLRRSYRLLVRFETAFSYGASPRFQLVLRDFTCVLWDMGWMSAGESSGGKSILIILVCRNM
jgi:hypothetical protein